MEFKKKYMVVLIVCLIGIGIVLYLNYDQLTKLLNGIKNGNIIDTFAIQYDQNPANIKMNILDLYSQLLNRQPTRTELIKNTRDIEEGTISIYGLRQQILDSKEYTNQAKLQSNDLHSELKKMISDKEIIDNITFVYAEELDGIIPPKMVLPLRDIYIYLEFNIYALHAMFRNTEYMSFETDCVNTPDLDNNQTMEIFNEYFSRSQLIKAGNAIAAVMESQKSSTSTECALNKRLYRELNMCDGNSSNLLYALLYKKGTVGTPNALSEVDRAQIEFNKNLAARQMSEGNLNLDFNSAAAKTEYKIPIQKGPYIILPEMAWAVPQPRAPVCTTLGQAPLIQPVMTNSTLLQSLSVDKAAKETGVGSIMPKFIPMQEYVSVKSG